MSVLRVGTTEGRFRMVMPDLMADFENATRETEDGEQFSKWENVHIQGFMGDAESLREMLSAGTLDLAFSGLTERQVPEIESRLILDEQLFYVISDHMLNRYRPEYTRDIQKPDHKVDLCDFTMVPVCRSLGHLHCMKILDEVLNREKIHLECVHVSGHYDLHLELALRDYAACFCLGMYLPYLKMINENSENKLHAFHIKGLTATNPVFLLQMRDRLSDPAQKLFVRLLGEKCRYIERLQAEI